MIFQNDVLLPVFILAFIHRHLGLFSVFRFPGKKESGTAAPPDPDA
jgi:hypothetical protein